MKKNHTDISGNDVSWFVTNKNIKELSEFEIDRISQLIGEGFTSGEIHMAYTDSRNRDHITSGWWNIINWQDIALELYNASKSAEIGGLPIQTLGMKQAQKRFEENWD